MSSLIAGTDPERPKSIPAAKRNRDFKKEFRGDEKKP
jgi:hypothetical protein